MLENPRDRIRIDCGIQLLSSRVFLAVLLGLSPPKADHGLQSIRALHQCREWFLVVASPSAKFVFLLSFPYFFLVPC